MKLKLIESSEKQRTIKAGFSFRGFSLFSGEKVSMRCEPGDENSGINFYHKGICIPALIEYLRPMEVHTTALSRSGVDILTIEHFMAAVWGLGIDNLKVTLSHNIVPAQDGSAESFVKAFLKVGIFEQKQNRMVIEFDEPTTLTQPEFENRLVKLEPHSTLLIKCSAPFPNLIGAHTIIFIDDPRHFADEVSWARTFLRSSIDLNDLTKWNGIRSVFKALPEDPKKSPIITYTDTEFLTPLKKEDEPARHKLLDLLGDLALIGYRIHAKITINEPGHKFTHLIAQEITKSLHK